MQKCVEVIFHFTNNFRTNFLGLPKATEVTTKIDEVIPKTSLTDLLLGASIITNGMNDFRHRSHEEMSTSTYLNLSLRYWTSRNMQLRMFSVACEFGSILRWCSWSQQEGLPWWWCLGTMLCGFAWCSKVQQFPRTVARDTVNLILKMWGGFGVRSSQCESIAILQCSEGRRERCSSIPRKVREGWCGNEITWNLMIHLMIWSESKDLNRPYPSKVRYPHPAFLSVNT